jgi:hypothetical protein
MQVPPPIDQCSKSLVGQDWDLQFVDYDHQQKLGSITYKPRTNHHQGFSSHPLETAEKSRGAFCRFWLGGGVQMACRGSHSQVHQLSYVPIPKE